MRVADSILSDKLEAVGAVLIEGPKYCGKTNITRLLVGETPRLIDEWQMVRRV